MAGSVNSTVLKASDIAAAKGVIANYIATAQSEFSSLKGVIDALTAPGADFNGDSSVGYNDFRTKIEPALTTNLYDQEASLMASLNHMLDSIEEALLNQVDPQLGQANREAGGE